jgi:hypothetical protein
MTAETKLVERQRLVTRAVTAPSPDLAIECANELDAAIERLTAELAAVHLEVRNYSLDLAAMTAERDALKKDAERYRWLKANHLQLGPDCWIRTGDDLDDATDAALAAAKEQP